MPLDRKLLSGIFIGPVIMCSSQSANKCTCALRADQDHPYMPITASGLTDDLFFHFIQIEIFALWRAHNLLWCDVMAMVAFDAGYF